MARGNGRMQIFLDDRDYTHFACLLGDIVERFDIKCWNYCVMPNHYHATLQPRRGNLSEALRRLNSVYAQWWNNRHRRVGHVFQGRFKDQIVQHEGYALTLCRYVVMNPVRAGLVERPETWRWSSYRATMGLCPCPSFLSIDSTLRLFGEDDQATLRARFADYVLGDQDEESIADRIRSSEPILGNTAFKSSIVESTWREAGVTQITADASEIADSLI
jgi:putative transposase